MTLHVELEAIRTDTNVRVEPGDVSTLAASILQLGLLQPLVVAFTDPDDTSKGYTLIAGQRRLAALKELGYVSADVIVKDHVDTATDLISVQWAENNERENLSAWEEAQVAWDLKLEGHNQAEVSKLMGVPKKEVSRLQKIVKHITSDDLDVTSATQLSAEALSEVVEVSDPDRAADVILAAVSGEHRSVWAANTAVTRQHDLADFYAEIADSRQQWKEMGVAVTSDEPTIVLGEKDRWGQQKHDRRTRKLVANLGFEIEDHIREECHVVWIHEPGYGKPQLSHWCINTKNHAGTTKNKPRLKQSPVLARDKKQQLEASADRKKSRLAKQQRRLQAVKWVGARDKAADRELVALEIAVSTWRHDHTKAALVALDLLGDRPTGAEYSWYTTTFTSYIAERFGDDTLAALRWKVKFLMAYKYIENRHDLLEQFADELKSIEVPDVG